ncbi:MAG: hypothetical protein SO070_07200 [Ruminococcus bromii]|jgi:hypothetical protein|nr:hypothetical protein [Ruminococcus bromii]MDY4978633.1 hypothetical protein [Ruminococcus bromii]
MLFKNHKSYCSENAAQIVCTENKKTYKAINKNSHIVFQYKIDGDVIPSSDSRKRCDYLLEDETMRKAFLIELKGTQLLHALEQIESTVNIFKPVFQEGGYQILPRIVYHNNTHDIHSSVFRKFKSKYPKTRAQTDYLEENI